MKRFEWGTIIGRSAGSPGAKRLTGENVELISDEMAMHLRGGDKDYSPMYEHEVEKQGRLTDPSMLVKL